MNSVRAVGTLSKRFLETLLVELVDGVACCLRIAAEVAGDLIGVVTTISAGKQDLATAQNDGIRRAQARLQGLALRARAPRGSRPLEVRFACFALYGLVARVRQERTDAGAS